MTNEPMSYKDHSNNDSSWCNLLINGSNVRAKVKHAGSGKYRFMEDKDDGKYVGTIVDASDIFHCSLVPNTVVHCNSTKFKLR
ncbi:MAG TPA: hypothetical protein VF884_09255 [Nitrososphaeraceae archaeon]